MIATFDAHGHLLQGSTRPADQFRVVCGTCEADWEAVLAHVDVRWFSRSELLPGKAALERLRAARVTVFGLGGVGSFAVEALARAGVGHLRLVDHDAVGRSNLNRQLFAKRSTIGQPKVAVATARVLDSNPDCDVEPRQTFIHTDTLPDLLTPRPDVMIDAIDSMTCKVALMRTAHGQGIPIITAMGAGGRTDSSQLFVGDLSETRLCPLAARVRKELRKVGITHGIRCVYSLEPADNKRPANQSTWSPTAALAASGGPWVPSRTCPRLWG